MLGLLQSEGKASTPRPLGTLLHVRDRVGQKTPRNWLDALQAPMTGHPVHCKIEEFVLPEVAYTVTTNDAATSRDYEPYHLLHGN